MGSLDIGQLGSTPAISTAAAGVSVKAIMVNGAGGAFHSFIVRKDFLLVDPCKTKGMRVGVFVGSTAYYAVMLAMSKRCGLSYKDYSFIMMEPSDVMVELEAGLVDAIIFGRILPRSR
jgi:ABC-type nitrate/sulfonate/bicarbonate transport system substrate-binding protein